MNKGFTLLEVLIALTLLAISFSGIYFLLNQSIDIESYSNNKIVAILKGYEKVVKYIEYNSSVSDETENNIKYNLDKKPTIYPSIFQLNLKTTYKDATQTYIFYETE